MSHDKSMPSQRQLRVGEQVRHALTEVLQRETIRDPVLEDCVLSVNEVRMSPDMRIATIYVTALGREDMQPVIKALAAHAKFIRGSLGPALRQMRFMPELRFRADTSYDNFSKIDELLRSPEVSRDLDRDEGGDE
ncbi:MAG: 30S ribosome-binding factor RbfA [Oricola sp.]